MNLSGLTLNDGKLNMATSVMRAICALGIVALSACWTLNLFGLFGLSLFNEQYMAAVLGLALAVIFLSPPEGKSQLYKAGCVIAACSSLVVCGYLAFAYPNLLVTMILDPVPGIVIGAVLIPLLAEALRRAAGTALFVIVLAALVIGVTAHFLPGHLTGRQVSAERLASYLALDPNGILGVPLLVTSTVVVAFMVFGALLAAAGGGNFFTDLALTAMGRFRGGTAKIAIFASALFGSVSGSAVANVVSTGIVTIPMMKRSGYSARDASAIEAAASTGGQLLPPVMGAVAFLMAEFLNLPYSAIALAALIPGLLYYFGLFLQADLLAARNGIAGLQRAELPRTSLVMREGGHYLIPFAILIFALFFMGLEAERAVAYSSATILVLWAFRGYRTSRIHFKRLLDALIGAGSSVADIIVIGASAGVIIGSLNITAFSFGLTLQLVSIGESSLLLLLITAAVLSIILGMGLPTLGVYLLLATLIAPSMVKLGLSPLAAHMYVFFYGMMSLITPPIAVAAFAAANIGKAPPVSVAVSAVKFALPVFVLPILFVYSPTLLMQGNAIHIGISVGTMVGGITAFSAALVGYWSRPLRVIERIASFFVGAGLMLPPDAVPYGIAINALGSIALILFWVRLRYLRATDLPLNSNS